VLSQPEPEDEQEEGHHEERRELVATLHVDGCELQHQDLDEEEDQQDLAEVAGEDLSVPQHEQHGTEQDVGREENQPESMALLAHAGDPRQAEQHHRDHEPAEDTVVPGVEVTLQGQGLGQQHELVRGRGFHGRRVPGPMLSCPAPERISPARFSPP
jgi:hypothetical protein